jgi:hypothetical protein
VNNLRYAVLGTIRAKDWSIEDCSDVLASDVLAAAVVDLDNPLEPVRHEHMALRAEVKSEWSVN